jgi:hypothetical protein
MWRGPYLRLQHQGADMGLVTWTAVFTLESLQDTSQEAAASLNGLIGADLQKNAKPILNAAGWNFGDAWPESHGWHSGATVDDEGKTIVATFVTSPELDEAEPDGRAVNNRWRIVVGLDVGMFPKTKARRSDLLRTLARDIDWEYGGPETTGVAKAL